MFKLELLKGSACSRVHLAVCCAKGASVALLLPLQTEDHVEVRANVCRTEVGKQADLPQSRGKVKGKVRPITGHEGPDGK